MEQANEELERVNEQFAQGLVSTKELAATKRRLLETEAAVLEMRQEIESQREIAESSRLSQLEGPQKSRDDDCSTARATTRD